MSNCGGGWVTGRSGDEEGGCQIRRAARGVVVAGGVVPAPHLTGGMNGYSRLGNGKPNGGSPTSPNVRGGRGGKGGGLGSAGKPVKLAERLVYFVISAVFRRKGILLLAPVMYIAGMLMYMGTLNLEAVQEGVGGAILRRAPVGSVYRSPKVFENLWPSMQLDGGNSSIAVMFRSNSSY